MKNIYSVFLMLCFPLIFLGQSTNQNYVHTTTYTIETTNENVSDDDKRESIIYYDGLGKPIQSIEKHFGNDKQNKVTPILYDEFGRQIKNYLPYPDSNPNQNNDDLYYRWDTDQLLLDTEEYYQNKFPEDLPDGGRSVYSATRLENSELGRTLEQGAPGEAWKIDFVNEEGYEYDLSDFNISLRNSDLLKQGDNTIIGSISLNDYRIELDFSVSWSNENKLKVGPVKDLGQDLPDLYLGDILHFGSATGYKAKIKNDHLVIYSDETVQSSVDVTVTHQIPNFNGWYNYDEAIFDPSVSQCVDNMGAGSGIIRLKISENGLVELIVSASWHPLQCMLSTGNIHYINYGGLIPDCELGYIIGSYKAKIENGYLIFYSENLPENLSGAILNKNIDVSDYIVDNDHTIKYSYGTNQNGEVTNYKVDFMNGNTEKTTLTMNGSYASNQLSKTITKNENWKPNQQYPKDHTVEEFMNKQGQVVFRRTYDKEFKLDTHYVYDDYGNLTYVIPPKASGSILNITYEPSPSPLTPVFGSWVGLVAIDSELAESYNHQLADYENESILTADIDNEYGGQGGYTLSKSQEGNLTMSISLSSTRSLSLKRGVVCNLEEIGDFPDMELGMISGLDYEYIFTISHNQLHIEGEGELTSINTTLTGETPLTYNHNYAWVDYIAVSEEDRLRYNESLEGYSNADILTAVIDNDYNGVGGLQFSLSDQDELIFNFNHSSTVPISLKEGVVLSLDIERRLPDVELGSISGNGYNYSFFLEENNLVVRGRGELTNFNAVLAYQFNKRPIIKEAVVDGLCYIYHYDYRNRLIEKKIPGKGWEYIVYDKLDRPVMTQDAVLRLDNRWLFTKYDSFDRVVYTGMYEYQFAQGESFSIIDRHSIQNLVNTQSGNPNIHSIYSEERKSTSVNLDGTQAIYYSNTVFPHNPQAIIELHSVSYYDNYDDALFFTTLAPSATTAQTFLPQYIEDTIDTDHLNTLSTGSLIRVLGTSDWIKSVTYYDKKSRPVYMASINDYLGSEDYSYSRLNFIGELEESGSLHIKGGENIEVINDFTYDHKSRLLTQIQTIDGSTPELIVNNKYNELGELINKKVGGSVSGNGLQTIDYSYNIRGWLTKINDPSLMGTNSMGNGYLSDDLFGFEISYNQPVLFQNTEPLYNGNISETIWKTSNDYNLRGYQYSYDAVNRIVGANYYGNYTLSSQDGINQDQEDYSLQNISYDSNGNIQSLSRYGVIFSNSDFEQVDLIDNLSYHYKPSSNQLESVGDTQLASEGFIDGNTTGNDYGYDLNGNMTEDKNKNITSINYNYLNLPNLILLDLDNNPNSNTFNRIEYVYSAVGTKLQKKVIEMQSDGSEHTIITDYAGHYIYKDNSLKFFSQAQGYVEPDNNGGFNYIYQYRDHLGNIKLSYKKNDVSSVSFLDDFTNGTDGWTSLYGTPMNVAGGQLNINPPLDTSGEASRAFDVSAGRRLYISFDFDQSFTGYKPYNYLSVEEYVDGNWQSAQVFGNQIPSTVFIDNTQFNFIPVGTKVRVRIGSLTNFSIDNFEVNQQAVQIIEENNYYPFGLQHKGYNNVVSSNANSVAQRFRYNGKELNQELGLNWYDYKARNYQPDLGRWFNVDPMATIMPAMSPYAYSFNSPIQYKDKDGAIPIIPLLLKAGANGAADMLLQVTMNYYFDDKVTTISAAFDDVNWWQVSRSAAEGLIPWRTPGGRLGRAAGTGAGDVLVNAISQGSNYSKEQALKDFALGFIGDLAGGGIGELVTKYGVKGVANGLRKMGFDYSDIKKLTGISGRYSGKLSKTNIKDDAADALATKLNGQSSVSFDSDSLGREFDVVSDEFIGQTKQIGKLGSKFRKQAKATFEAAKETGRSVYYQLNSNTSQDIINKINEYSDRYGVNVVIELVD